MITTTGLPAPLVIGLAGRIRRFGRVDLNGRLGLGIPLGNLPGLFLEKDLCPGRAELRVCQEQAGAERDRCHGCLFAKPDWLAGEDIDRAYFEADLEGRLSHLVLGVILRSSPLTSPRTPTPAG